jgi:hypothetical protein
MFESSLLWRDSLRDSKDAYAICRRILKTG